jgi:hypothetical protein
VEIYAFITSEHCKQLLDQVETQAGRMLDLDSKEQEAHRRLWDARKKLINSVQKARSDLVFEIDRIIGTAGNGPGDEGCGLAVIPGALRRRDKPLGRSWIRVSLREFRMTLVVQRASLGAVVRACAASRPCGVAARSCGESLRAKRASLALQLDVVRQRPASRRAVGQRRPATAQPGSRSWAQSRKRHRAVSASTSAKVAATPASASQRPSSRIPGVSSSRRRSAAHELAMGGGVAAARVVLADRRRGHQGAPASALTRLDLPTPELPSSAAVWPGAKLSAQRLEARAGHRPRPRAPARRAPPAAISARRASRIRAQVCLGEHHDRRGSPALPRRWRGSARCAAR